MKIVNLESLDRINPVSDCFIIKSVFSEGQCLNALSFLQSVRVSAAENQKISGENWYYNVQKGGTSFTSFLFNEISAIECPLLEFYRTLHRLYRVLGEDIDPDFDKLTRLPSDMGAKTINPLVFWYPALTGVFDWHQHPAVHQKFQLLANLTRPKVDYSGGHTHIRMENGEVGLFDEKFEQGDVFGFPYHLWHRVDPIANGTTGVNARVSLLMPLHPRSGIPTNYARSPVG